MKRYFHVTLGIISMLCCMAVCICAKASSIKDENILFDAADVIMYVNDGTLINCSESFDYLEFEVIVENHSSRNIFLGIDTACMNDWVIDPYGPGSIPAGKKKMTELSFDINIPDIHSWADIHTLEIEWIFFDDDSYDTIAEVDPLTISFVTENGQTTYKFIRGSDDKASESTPSAEPESTSTPLPKATPTPEPKATPTSEPKATATFEPKLTDSPSPEASESTPPQSTPNAEAVSEEWFSSDDSVIKARLGSIDSSAYPLITIEVLFCLEGEKNEITETVRYWIWDLSNSIGDLAAKNPSYGNRKIPINVKQINAFSHIRGTVYELYIDYSLGTNDEFSGSMNVPCVDLADLWPDKYINYDASRAAFYIREIQKSMFTPSSLDLREAKVYFSDDDSSVVYYYFKISGQVRAGGQSIAEYVTRYDSENGGYFIYDCSNSKVAATNYQAGTTDDIIIDVVLEFASGFSGRSVCDLL